MDLAVKKPSAADQLDVVRLTGNIGAEISGVDLSKPLGAEMVGAIRDLFLAHKVITFPDQHLDGEQLRQFGLQFGELSHYPLREVRADMPPGLQMITEASHTDVWHIDHSWRLEPPSAIVLHALELPDYGGDTMFSSGAFAYSTLPEEVKEQIDQLFAIHDMTRLPMGILPKEELIARQRNFPVLAHPVVRTHPETDEKMLYVNRLITTQILGMELAESHALLERLFSQYYQPEGQYRHRWKKNTLIMWDNRAVQHYGVSDYDRAQPRRLQRVTLAGDRPYR